MKTRVIVYFLLTCGTLFTILWLVRGNRQWKEMRERMDYDNLQGSLNYAASTGDIDLAKASIARGADINYQGRDGIGCSRLWVAVEYGQIEMVRFLLDHGADPNGGKGPNPLMHLCYRTIAHTPSCNLSMAKLLLEHSADPDAHQEKHSALGAARLSEPFKTNMNAELIALLQQYGAKD